MDLRYLGFNKIEVSIKTPQEKTSVDVTANKNLNQDESFNDTLNNVVDDLSNLVSGIKDKIQTDTSVNTNDVSSGQIDGMRKEFKEAMDSYEAFFDEYVEFIDNYTNSESTASLLLEYAQFMAQYEETYEKMEAWEDNDLNDVEAAYYLEVTSRITQKLISIAY